MSRVLPSRPIDYLAVISTHAPLPSSCSPPSPSPSSSTSSPSSPSLPSATQPGSLCHSTSKPFPALKARFPLTDHRDAEFPREMAMFAFPSLNFSLSAHSKEKETFSFVLTEADGARVFASAVRWYERADEEVVQAERRRLSRAKNNRANVSCMGADEEEGTSSTASSTSALDNTESVLFAPICVVLTSHWPFFAQMERYLNALYRVINVGVSAPGIPFPIERSFLSLIFETPLPPAGQVQVEAHPLPSLTLLFSRPPPNRLPLRDFSLLHIFRFLGVDNVLTVFAAMATEKRVLFTSNSLHRLTLAAECMLSLLFPFFWRSIYVSILPQQLLEFSAAPMPYIMGVPREYMPDPELLDSCLLVELDTNCVKWNADAEGHDMAPLPSVSGAALARNLKQLVSTEGNVPIKNNVRISEDELQACFVRFFAKLFASYREFIVSPNEHQTDKFDRGAFLTAHEDRNSTFLKDLLETQMFTSFLDDRGAEDRHALANDGSGRRSSLVLPSSSLDVLVFDEWIDREAGKATPFLSDTSHDHASAKRYTCPLPYYEDVQPRLYNYTFFPDLHDLDLYAPRSPPQLSSPASAQYSTSASLSMQFFTQKRAYSQYFHSLRLCSSKYDILLKDIQRFVKERALVDEGIRNRLDTLSFNTFTKDLDTGNSSTGAAWQSLKQFVREQSQMEAEAFQHLREDMFIPITVATGACEFQLKLLFAEAASLESKTAKLKSSSERAKAKASSLRQRYQQQRKLLLHVEDVDASFKTPFFSTVPIKPASNKSNQIYVAPSPLLPPLQINQLIGLLNEWEDAALLEEEEVSSFRSIVQEYEQRLPEIVNMIKDLNRERLNQTKQSLSDYCQVKRKQLETMMSNLSALEDTVEGVDVEYDVKLLSQPSIDLARVFLPQRRVASVTPIETQHISLIEDKMILNSAKKDNDEQNELSLSSYSRSHEDNTERETDMHNPLSRSQSPVVEIHDSPTLGPTLLEDVLITNAPPIQPVSLPPAHPTATSPAKLATHPSSAPSTNASSFRIADKALIVTHQPPSPLSTPNKSSSSLAGFDLKLAGRIRALSSTSNASTPSFSRSQPSSPVLSINTKACTPDTSALSNGSVSSALPSMFKPRYNRPTTSSSLNSLVSSSHKLEVHTNDSKLGLTNGTIGITFLRQMQLQHALEDLRDRERQHNKMEVENEYRTKGLAQLSELEPSYALNLWGDSPGFEAALAQATANKRALKEFTVELEQWANCIEAKKRKLGVILAQQPRVLGNGSTQQKAWESFKGKIASSIKAYGDFLGTVHHCINELRLQKGEVKGAVNRAQTHKLKLDQEIAVTQEEVNRASQKRSRMWSALQMVESAQANLNNNITQKHLELHSSVVDKAIRDFKEADHEHMIIERSRVVCNHKVELCRAGILMMLEKKDKESGFAFQHLLTLLADSYGVQCVGTWRKADDALLSAIREVCLSVDFAELVVSTYDARISAEKRLAQNTLVDFAVHFSHVDDFGFQVSNVNLTRSIEGVRQLSELLGALAECEEQDAKQVKKALASVKKKSAKNTTVVVALSMYDAWLLQQIELCEELVKSFKSSQVEVGKLRSFLLTVQKMAEKTITEAERTLRRAQEEAEKAENDCRHLDELQQANKMRANKAEQDNDLTHANGTATVSQKSGFLSAFGNSSIDSLKVKLVVSEAELQKAKQIWKTKAFNLKEEHFKRQASYANVMRDIQAAEESKWTSLSNILINFATLHKTWCDRAILYAGQYRNKVQQIDPQADMFDFLTKNRSNITPPMQIIEEEIKRVSRERYEAEQKQSELEKMYKERQSLLTQSRSRHAARTPVSSAPMETPTQTSVHTQQTASPPIQTRPDASNIRLFSQTNVPASTVLPVASNNCLKDVLVFIPSSTTEQHLTSLTTADISSNNEISLSHLVSTSIVSPAVPPRPLKSHIFRTLTTHPFSPDGG